MLTALLDLSAAFDTLNHSIFLKRPDGTFGVRDLALKWSVSYVEDRFQSVIVDSGSSTPSPLVYGVPQGSVLGPILFTLYSQPLSGLFTAHEGDYRRYADDNELSKSAPPDDFSSVQFGIHSCIEDLLCWMTSNTLKLNTDKTEVMPIVVLLLALDRLTVSVQALAVPIFLSNLL